MAGFTGVVHREPDGTLWFDDVAVRSSGDVPRRRAWRGKVFYATSSVMPTDLFKLMQPGDKALGPSPGKLTGVIFRIDARRSFRIFTGELWGVKTRDPHLLDTRIQERMVISAGAGFDPGTSAAGTAIRRYMRTYDGRDGRPESRKLPCRWRGLAHAAFHGGPIVVTTASAENAVHLDIKGAYLDALYQPVPVLGRRELKSRYKVGGWYTIPGTPWEKVRDYTGLVDATVWIDPASVDKWGIAPLPVKLFSGSVFPTGVVRGAWTIQAVREAEERGEVEVRTVHQWAFAPETMPLFEAMADDFRRTPAKVAKLLYTRFWGKWGSRGGFEGVVTTDPPDGSVRAGGLWWSFTGIDLHSTNGPPTYRPDIAAFIASHNHRKVIHAVRQLRPGSVVAAHVDAIWTTDLNGAQKLAGQNEVGAWQRKGDGPLRFYGAGCYDHAGRLGASGYDSTVFGPLTSASLRDWSANANNTHRRMLFQSRLWSADPAIDPLATSAPLQMDMSHHPPPTEGPSIDSDCWTFSGWFSQDSRAALGLP